MKTANHYSHSFELNLTNIPGKASDRIALRILYPGLLAGFALMFLALYEFGNGFLSSGSFDAVFAGNAGENAEPLFSPAFFDCVIFIIGAWIVSALFMSYIRYRKILFDGKNIQIVDRQIGGKKNIYKEALKNYEGVQLRIEFFQFGFLNKNRYIIELRHKNLHKVAPLYISTSGKNIRSKWKYYAKKLNLPALILTNDGLVKRDVEDLDKSVKELFREGKLKNDYNAADSLPESVILVRKKDKTVIKMAKILWDAYNIIAWGIIILAAAALLAFVFAYDGGFSSTVFVIGSLLVLLCAIISLFRRDKIAIKKHKLVIVHKFPLRNLKKDEINKNDIEAIVVTENPATGRYFLSITSNTKNVIFGKKMPAEALDWIRKYLVNNIGRQ